MNHQSNLITYRAVVVERLFLQRLDSSRSRVLCLSFLLFSRFRLRDSWLVRFAARLIGAIDLLNLRGREGARISSWINSRSRNLNFQCRRSANYRELSKPNGWFIYSLVRRSSGFGKSFRAKWLDYLHLW